MAGLIGAPLHGGFNQSGGGYYMVLSTLTMSQVLSYLGGSGSGGSYNVGSLSTFHGAAAAGIGPSAVPSGDYSTALLQPVGTLFKDMGKTVVSSGRTFRKFQSVKMTAGTSSPSFGVTGPTGTATVPGYLSFYLEIGREGAGGQPAQIVRYA